MNDKKRARKKFMGFTEEDIDEVATEFYLKGLIFSAGIMGLLWFMLG